MNNLKKVLALVLVVATLCGFMTVAGAKDFTDKAAINNDEAVEVMTAIGVINGFTDGSFQPNGQVTRAQMAKMVSAIMNGGEDVGPLYSAANVFTDCGYHWARGYIAYATQVKLVAGLGNGTFNPDGNVTGTEAAKMLLCALGYEPEREGLVGTTWAAKTLSLAKDAGLTAGFPSNFDFSKPLSRENAAQMMLNALKADMVEYGNDATSITIGGEVISIGGVRATKVTNDAAWAKTIKSDTNVQLGEKSYDGKLVLTSADTDFKRPAEKWTYNKKAIGTYENDEPILTYTTKVKGKDVWKDLGVSDDAVKVEIYVDGVRTSSTTAADSTTVTKTAGDITATGNGATTEIYTSEWTTETGTPAVTTAHEGYRIVIVNEYLVKVNNVVKAKGDNARYITFTDFSADATSAGLDASDKFETEDFAKNDLVLVTVAGGEVKSVEAPEVVENVAVTAYKSGDSVTAGGTKYSYSAKLYNSFANTKTYVMKSGNTYDLYLDSCGNVIYAIEHSETNDQYIYVTAIGNEQGEFAGRMYRTIEYVDMTGKVATYKVNASKTATSNVDDEGRPGAVGWYTVKDDSDNADYKVFTQVGQAISVSETKNSVPTIDTGVVANGSTIFILQTDDNEYKSYEGIANLPAYKQSGSPAMTGAAVVVDSYAKVVYIDVATNGEPASTGAADLVYVIGQDGVTSVDDNDVKVYDAIVDGKKVQVNSAITLATGLHKVKSYDNNGCIKTTDPITTTGSGYTVVDVTGSNKTIHYSKPTLEIGTNAFSCTITDDTTIYMVGNDADDIVVDAGTLEGTAKNGDDVAGMIYVVHKSDDDPAVTAIYIDCVID